MKVQNYRLQDFDVVQLNNNIIALYYGYDFIFCYEHLRVETKNQITHTAFNEPRYTGNHKNYDLKVKRVKHNIDGLVNMEWVLNPYDFHEIDWDIEFE